MIRTVVVLLGVVLCSSAVSRPHYLIPCARSHDFNECAFKNAKHAIPFILQGDKDLKIPVMNPLHIPLVDLKGTNHFRLKISDMEVHGLNNVNLLGIKADFDKRRLEVNSTVDKITVLGNYEISGKILVFPLSGHGRVNITLYNGFYQYGVKWESEYRGGKEYTKIIDGTYDYSVDKISFNFENLFNGDKLLGDQMNIFLNENWQIVNEDLKGAFVQTLLAIHTDVAAKIFSKIPVDELFLD